jgi:hypothetical protein
MRTEARTTGPGVTPEVVYARYALELTRFATVALVLNQSSGSSRVTVEPGPAARTHGAGLTGPGPAGFPAPLGPIQDSDASTGPGDDGVNAVVVHLVVDADGVTGGEKIHGHLQVINNTRHALRKRAVCRADVLAPVMYGGRFPERPVFPASSCAQPFTFPVGVTTLPFTVTASYDSPAGLRPLPTGYYHVGVVVSGPHSPVPAPLTVIVLPSGLHPSRAAVHRLNTGQPLQGGGSSAGPPGVFVRKPLA